MTQILSIGRCKIEDYLYGRKLHLPFLEEQLDNMDDEE
jgi:hypothetical protein